MPLKLKIYIYFIENRKSTRKKKKKKQEKLKKYYDKLEKINKLLTVVGVGETI